jgi:hypothetical protein
LICAMPGRNEDNSANGEQNAGNKFLHRDVSIGADA